MELKAKLDKPYSLNDRLSFIIENNQNHGYRIIDSELALEAWGYTQEEIQEQERQARNREIDEKIAELNEMLIPELVNNNTENIELYKEVIAGLEQARP